MCEYETSPYACVLPLPVTEGSARCVPSQLLDKGLKGVYRNATGSSDVNNLDVPGRDQFVHLALSEPECLCGVGNRQQVHRTAHIRRGSTSDRLQGNGRHDAKPPGFDLSAVAGDSRGAATA